jgi:hypothetical protein
MLSYEDILPWMDRHLELSHEIKIQNFQNLHNLDYRNNIEQRSPSFLTCRPHMTSLNRSRDR